MFHTGNAEFIHNFSTFFLISEIANYLCIIAILIIVTAFKLVPKKYFIFWCFYFLTPFLGNYFLFDPSYMPDQYIYTETLNEIRSNGFPEIKLTNYEAIRNSVTNLSSIFFSFIPLFSTLTISSIAFANQVYALMLFIFLRKKIENFKIIFLLLVPSFILYSSVSLREILIIFFTVISMISLIEKKYIVSFFCISLIFIFKIQNSIALLIIYFGMLFFRIHKSTTALVLVASTIILGSYVFFYSYIPFLNLYREAFALEAGIDRFIVDRGIIATTYFDFVFTTGKSFISSLIRPFPWETGGLGLIIFFENIILLYVIYGSLKDIFSGSKNKVLLGTVMILGIVLTMCFYAYTITNLGTLSRYRFTTIYPFIFVLLYINQMKLSQSHEEK